MASIQFPTFLDSATSQNSLVILTFALAVALPVALFSWPRLLRPLLRRLVQRPLVGDEANILKLVQSHQEKAARLSLVDEIRTVLDSSARGMLSTFPQKHESSLSGSMVDYACDVDGCPVLAISSLDVNTKDILANPKCSLVVAKDPEDMTDLVVTLHGVVIISVGEKDKEAIRVTYLKKHPNALESHMNKDHGEDTKLIVHHSTSIPVDSASIVDLDSLGFNVKANYQGTSFKLRIPFPRRAEDRKDVKTLIVEMLQAAKASC
ncbi:unnamed protein product [Rhodiola kirilowii]